MMNNDKLRNAALGLLTAGSAVFGVGAAKEPLSRVVTVPDVGFTTLMVVGGALVGIGAIAYALVPIFERVERVTERVWYPGLNSRHVCSNVDVGELAGLYEMYAKYFGAEVPSTDLMHSWVSKAPSAFVTVHRVVQDSGLATDKQLVGSFKVLPLTVKGVRAIELGQATGSTLRLEHICARRARPSAYWVGDVVGKDKIARAVVLAHLEKSLEGISAPVYARPLTTEGRTVMTQHGFLQVADGRSRPELGKVCKLQPTNAKPRPPKRRTRIVPSKGEHTDA